MLTSLIAFAIRLLLVAAMTFVFVVLFEHGPSNFLQSVSLEAARLQSAIQPPDTAKTPEVPR